MTRTFPHEKNVSDLAEKEYVALIGMVVGRDDKDYSLMVDDGTGTLKVFAEKIFEVGDVVCCMGKTERLAGIVLTNALIVDMGDFDRELYARLRAMEVGE
jgi:hypothetical protein